MCVVIRNLADSSAFPGPWWIGISQNWCPYFILGHYKQYRIKGGTEPFPLVFLHLFLWDKSWKPNCYWTSCFFWSLTSSLWNPNPIWSLLEPCCFVSIVSKIIKQKHSFQISTPLFGLGDLLQKLKVMCDQKGSTGSIQAVLVMENIHHHFRDDA